MRSNLVLGALVLLVDACSSASDAAPNAGTRSDPDVIHESSGAAAVAAAVGGSAAAPVAGSLAQTPAVAGAGMGGASGSAGMSAGAAGVAAGVGGSSGAPASLPIDKLSWTTCDRTYQCATLKAPIDYANPTAGTLNLALKRAPARGQRIGSLLINPGGPGGSAIEFLTSFVGGATALVARFDIVAFDPRGVGQSTPVDCHSTLQALTGADPSPDDEAEWTTLEQVSKTFADECAKKHAALLPYLGTQNVARDMDRVREALGEPKLTYLGFSYGTELGAWYAELFPTHVGALVLDGAVDVRLSALELAFAQGQGFELALSDYFKWCKADATRCSWTQNKTPADEFMRLAKLIETKPLPANRSDRPLGPGAFALGVIAPLYGGEAGWRSLSTALAAAESGDGNALITLADKYLGRAADGSYPNLTDANNAVNCLDHSAPSVDAVRAQADRFTMAAPNFGMAALTQLLVCSYWGVPGKDAPPPQGLGAAPIVVIGTTHDPATPYAWAQALAQQLDSGVLLTADGEGHTAYLRGNPCIDDTVNAYFISGKVPTDGTRCSASGMATPGMLQLPAMR